ncbi:hypothetical protein BJP34_12210 [Moorena producens PAL-8-15-08-1]|uniref:Uncharacterized protein n=1 Tax=Moorena producens PAL-8-15-08-1 TaxID=1458985 RepID=A0A1D8TR31_9CYAN|nr:hypothetical protein BJP34_12210 [Moorena producens PAL-8-15-08-1]
MKQPCTLKGTAKANNQTTLTLPSQISFLMFLTFLHYFSVLCYIKNKEIGDRKKPAQTLEGERWLLAPPLDKEIIPW